MTSVNSLLINIFTVVSGKFLVIVDKTFKNIIELFEDPIRLNGLYPHKCTPFYRIYLSIHLSYLSTNLHVNVTKWNIFQFQKR